MEQAEKILLLDIETSPLVSYTWGLYEQNVIKKIKPFTILSVAYKWLGGKTKVLACDFLTEKELLVKLHAILDEASIVIAHNGDSFDMKKINTRFIIHRMAPPSPYKTIDTKKAAKRIAAFDSNSLNNLGIDLCEGEKFKHRGFDMWEGCMAGKRSDWRDMKRYNKKDVDLLELIYLRLRPYINNHPAVKHGLSCPKCGSDNFQSRGSYISQKTIYRRFQCTRCGGWAKKTIKGKETVSNG